MKRRAILFAVAAVAASGVAASLRPTQRASRNLHPIRLDEQIPKQFGSWRLDPGIIPVLPDPALQEQLDKIYGQVLARTYVDTAGRRVMLSIAYGEDQGTDATAAHRPEFCYSAQGFSVKTVGEARLQFNGHALVARRMLGSLGPRFEPITYWVTLNETAVLPGARRKLEQIRLGLNGQIPDGMLVRVSTVGLTLVNSFQAQDDFLTALHDALPVTLQGRYFGSRTA